MISKRKLHQDADVLLIGPKRTYQRIIIHSLIDLGYVTSLECAWESCVLPGVPLSASGRTLDGFTIDHIIAINDGGTDRPENIQLLHHTCNMRKGAIFTDERRAKIGAALVERWKDPTYKNTVIAKVTAANRTDATRAKRSASMKHHWSDSERKSNHISRLSRGDDHWLSRPGARDLVTCDCGQVCKGVSALRQHQTKMHIQVEV